MKLTHRNDSVLFIDQYVSVLDEFEGTRWTVPTNAYTQGQNTVRSQPDANTAGRVDLLEQLIWPSLTTYRTIASHKRRDVAVRLIKGMTTYVPYEEVTRRLSSGAGYWLLTVPGKTEGQLK